ncbi:MAG TPA: hypothetical protein VFT55_01585, partial [Planctomycetota bacterium]|nr:hypothetical protein [Planctomycetota bacterium]
MTRSDESVGTPAYMAPEQVDGRPVDRRVDVHALGVLLHEAIALRHPFTGSAAEPPTRERLYRAILDQDASSLRTTCPGAGVDRDLEAVLATAMAKDADRRYATAKALADDLQRWLDRVPVVARRVTMLGRLRRWGQRRPALAAALAGTFLALAAGLSVTTYLLVRLQGEQTRTAAALAHARATALRAEAANVHAASPRTALHLALAAHDLEPGEPSRSAVYAAWTRLPEHATLPAGSDTLVRAANSPDRAFCVLGCADGSARLVSLRDQRVTTLPGGDGPVTAAAVADGGALVLLAHGPVLTVWRDDAPPVRVACERTIYAIVRTADGGMITGHADGRLVVRDVLGQPRRELQALAAAAASLAVAADGSVAACAVDGQVQVTSAAGEVVAAWHSAPDAVTTVTALRHGNVLLVPAPAARTVRLLDVATATPRDVAVPFALARCCAVGDGRRLALLGTWGQAHLLDLASGRTSPLAGGAAIHALAADERGAIAFATSDGDLAVVLPDGRRRHTHIGDTPIRWLEFTADGRLHAATEDGAGLVWALHSVSQCQPDGNDGVHTLACFAPDGTLLGGVRGGVACVPVDGPATVLPATPNAVAAVVAAADGRHLLAVLKDGHVEALARDGTRLCRVAAAAAPGPCGFVGAERFVCLDDQCARLFALDGRLLATLAIAGRRTTALAVAPSGRFAVGSEAGDVVVCDPDGARLLELAAASHVDAMEFGPGDQLAIAERTGELLVISADGASRAGWRAHRGRISSIDFAPTGQRLLVAGDDGTAAVFDLAGQRQRHLQPGGGPLLGARFLPRRGLIATVTRQGAVHLWSDTDGTLFGAVPAADRPPLDFCVAPAGDRLVLSGYACAFTVLPLDEATLLGRARELAGDLPAPERARYAALLDPELS